MKSTQFTSLVQSTLVPLAFLVAPAVTPLACAGTGQQTPPAQEPEERDDSTDPYEGMCEEQHRRGEDCPTRAEWYKKLDAMQR